MDPSVQTVDFCFYKKSNGVSKSAKDMQRLAKILPDQRDPDKITHQQKNMIKQRLLSLCAGYEDINDQDTLRHDILRHGILMQTLVGSDDPRTSAKHPMVKYST